MKRFLRYFLYRKGYRLLRKSLRNAGSESSSESSNSTQSAADRRQQLLENPNIPADGSTVDSPEQLIAVLQQMDPYEFEHFVADLWERMGWETEVSSASADKGVDIIARKSVPYDQMLLIQAKRYGPNSTVGSPDVQQYASLRHQYNGVDKVLIVTTNGYSRQAKEIAAQLNVKLIDGEGLAHLITEHESLDLVAEYLDFIEPADETGQPQEAKPAEETETVEDWIPEESTTQSEQTSNSTASDEVAPIDGLPSTLGHKITLAAALSWIVVFFSVLVLPDSLWFIFFLSTWFALPIGMFLDARELSEYVEWPKYTWAYLLTSLIWFLAVIPAAIYLWKRRAIATGSR